MQKEKLNLFNQLFEKLKDDHTSSNFTKRYIEAVSKELQPAHRIDEILKRMRLSEISQRFVSFSPQCERILFEGDTMACNLDKKTKRGMKYFCHYCFGKKDQKDCEVRVFKTHGICQNVVTDDQCDPDITQHFYNEIGTEEKQEIHTELKNIVSLSFLALFSHVELLVNNNHAVIIEDTFASLCDLLLTACQKVPSFSYTIMRAFTDKLDGLKEEGLGAQFSSHSSILEVYFYLNSKYDCVPMYMTAKLFSYLTIYQEFNYSLFVCFFKYLHDTYTYDKDDNRITYYQLLYRMCTFDSKSAARYLKSDHYRDYMRELEEFYNNHIDVYNLMEDISYSDYFIFSSEQLNLILEKQEAVEALFEDSRSLHSYLKIHLAMHRRDPINSREDSYLTDEIECMNTILEIHDSFFVSLTNILGRLWFSPRRKEYLKMIMKGVVSLVGSPSSYDHHCPSLALPVQRIFALCIISLITDNQYDEKKGKEDIKVRFSLEAVVPILSEILPDESIRMMFFAIGVREVVQAVGFTFEIARKVWARFGDGELQMLADDYRKTYFNLWDCDIFFIKLSFLVLPAEDISKIMNYFSSISHFKDLFSSDPSVLITSINEVWFEKAYLLFKDFWQFISYTLVDEICISNLSVYCVDEPTAISEENSHLEMHDEAKEIAKTILFCMGSCSASKLSELAFWYLPYKKPFLKIVLSELEYDSRTHIFRLPQNEVAIQSKTLKFERLYRDCEVTSETFEKLVEKKMNPVFSLTTPAPLLYKGSSEVIKKVFETSMVQGWITLLSLNVQPHPLINQLIPLFLRLSNNYLVHMTHLNNVPTILSNHFCINWANVNLEDRPLEEMITSFKTRVEDILKKSDNSMVIEKDTTRLSEDEAKAAAKKKMEDKLAKAKAKMKGRCQPLLNDLEIAPEEGIEVKMELRKNTCGFCMQEVDQVGELCLPVYIRIHKCSKTKIAYPIVSSCGHVLHKTCFNEWFKLKKLKKPKWTFQSQCLQCKLLSNSFIIRRSTYIDVDYLKKTIAELSETVYSIMNHNITVDTNIDNILIYFISFLSSEVEYLKTGILMTNFLDCYYLLTEHLQNTIKNTKPKLEGTEYHPPGFEEILIQNKEMVKGIYFNILMKKESIKNIESNSLFKMVVDYVKVNGTISTGSIRISLFIIGLIKQNWYKSMTNKQYEMITDTSESGRESLESISQDVFQLEAIPFNPRSEDIQNKDQNPQFLALESSFNNVISKDLHLGCSLCTKWPDENSTNFLLCLLCGDRSCEGSCIDSKDKTNQTRHVLEKHGGSGIFISLLDGKIKIVEPPISSISINARS